jgi:hypothetical protein
MAMAGRAIAICRGQGNRSYSGLIQLLRIPAKCTIFAVLRLGILFSFHGPSRKVSFQNCIASSRWNPYVPMQFCFFPCQFPSSRLIWRKMEVLEHRTHLIGVYQTIFFLGRNILHPLSALGRCKVCLCKTLTGLPHHPRNWFNSGLTHTFARMDLLWFVDHPSWKLFKCTL